MLGAEDAIGTSLDVTTRGQRDQDVDLGNQIFFRQSTRNVLNFRASLVAVLLFEVGHISANDVEDQFWIGEQSLQAADLGAYFLELVLNLAPFQTCQASKSHVEDGSGLDFSERESLLQVGAGSLGGARSPDSGDDLVDMIEGNLQAFQDVGTSPSAVELELGTPSHYLLPVRDVLLEGPLECQRPGLGAAFDKGHHVHAEGGLQLSV